MSPPNPVPRYAYKIHLTQEDGQEFTYPLSDLDRTDGFIHLSTADQVPLTADRFFASQSRLLIQKIELSSLIAKTGSVKWEESHGSMFPHWYVEPLEGALAEVGMVKMYTRSEGASWAQVLAQELED